MKYFGKNYLYIKSELHNDLKPPYKIWIEDQGFIDIDSETIEIWANADIEILE